MISKKYLFFRVIKYDLACNQDDSTVKPWNDKMTIKLNNETALSLLGSTRKSS